MRCQRGFLVCVLDIAFLDAAVVEGVEIIKDRHRVAVGEQRIDEMASDEARPPGYQVCGSCDSDPMRRRAKR